MAEALVNSPLDVKQNGVLPEVVLGANVEPVPRTSEICIELANDYLMWTWSEAKEHRVRLVLDHEVSNHAKVLEYVKRFTSLNIDRGCTIKLYLSVSDAILRSFYVPAVPRGELQQVVMWEAGKVFPFQPNPDLFAWRVTDTLDWGGVKKHQIQATAIAPTRVESLCEYLSAHFNVKTLTLIPLAWEASLNKLSKKFPSIAAKSTVIIRLFGHRLSLFCYNKTSLEFIRDVELDESVTGDEFENALNLLQDRHVHQHDFNAYKGFDMEALARLIGEELDYYYGRFSQRSVELVLLTFPTEIEEASQESIKASLGIPVESLTAQADCKSPSGERCAHLLAPLVMQGNLRSQSLDLLPRSYRDAVNERRNFRWSLMISVIMVLVTVALSVAKIVYHRQLDATLLDAERRRTELLESPTYKDIIALQTQGAAWQTQLEQLRGSYATHSEFLRAISTLTPENIYLSGMELHLIQDEKGNQLAGVAMNGFVSSNEQYPEVLLTRYIRSLREQSIVKTANLQNQLIELYDGIPRLRFTLVLEVIS